MTRLQRVELDELRDVVPPAADADEYGRLLAQMQATLELYPDLRAAVLSGQDAAMQDVLQRSDSSNRLAAESALELGLDDCVPDEAEGETTSDR